MSVSPTISHDSDTPSSSSKRSSSYLDHSERRNIVQYIHDASDEVERFEAKARELEPSIYADSQTYRKFRMYKAAAPMQKQQVRDLEALLREGG